MLVAALALVGVVCFAIIWAVNRPKPRMPTVVDDQSPCPGGTPTFLTLVVGDEDGSSAHIDSHDGLKGLTYSYKKAGLVDLPNPENYLRDEGAVPCNPKKDGKPDIVIVESVEEEPHYLISYAGYKYWVCADHYCLRMLDTVDWMIKDWKAARSQPAKSIKEGSK